jgi:hypothetical protein
MADKLRDQVNRATDNRQAPRPRMYELDPGKEYTQGKFDADQAGRRADQEDDAARRAGYMQGYAKGGQVGKVGSFGLKRSKPDFAGGGSMLNRRSFTKRDG